MSIDIDSLGDAAGLRVTDHIENAKFELYTDRPVEPVPTDGEEHYFPVDASVRFEASAITVPRVATVDVRDGAGRVVAEGGDLRLERGEYSIEITPSPTKTYLHVEAGLHVDRSEERSILRFDEQTTVSAGFRSFNEQPAGTITTPPDPESLMRAVSLLGSSLATTSPERSFSTLRGHPPLIELGDSFSVPETVETVDTGIRIVVPPEYESVYAVASLAHYLGAQVSPGRSARIEGDGWTHPLEPSVETAASEVLRQVFHLDCLVRTEGIYPIDLYERRAVESALTIDYARLYDLPLERRLEDYLELSYDAIAPHLPQWPLTADIRPDPEYASSLPYLAGDLALIRCSTRGSGTSEPEPDHVSDFLRSPSPEARSGPMRGAGTESVRGAATRGAGFGSGDTEFVQPDPVDTVEHVWIGEGVPLGANKATAEAYHRRIGRESPKSGPISVSVVCNDDRMREEGDVGNLYGLRDILQFDIDVNHDLTRDEMDDLLSSDTDFLHYIGHVDERGMQCRDGYLDLTRRESDVAIDSFLLNACQSYQQGEALIRGGSRGGIVTLTDVANAPATRLGRIIARLMNSGFNLRTALHVAQRALITGHQYSVLGDGGVTLCQSRSGAATVFDLTATAERRFDLEVQTFPIGAFATGSFFTLSTEAFAGYCLVPSTVEITDLPEQEIERLLELEVFPVFYDGALHWSDELLPL